VYLKTKDSIRSVGTVPSIGCTLHIVCVPAAARDFSFIQIVQSGPWA